jgi:hypothetical protein
MPFPTFAPTKRQNNGICHDVAALCQEAWLYGPDSALNVGHHNEKILLLMAADTAASPTRVAIFQNFIAFLRNLTDKWWSAQIGECGHDSSGRRRSTQPGSSRSNSTNYFSSK